MKEVNLIKLFVSCPGDVKSELGSIRLIVEELNKILGSNHNFKMELVDWNMDTYTDISSEAQSVINEQLNDEYDILIGIIGLRAGTPTKQYDSGTIEEINISIDNKKKQLIFFKSEPPQNIYELDIDQFQKVKKFKEELKEKGLLYKDYSNIQGFESLFRTNLSNLIMSKFIKKDKSKNSSIIKSIKSESIDDIQDVEHLIQSIEANSSNDFDIDIFELNEFSESNSNTFLNSLKSLTNIINSYTDLMTSRTSDFNSINTIKDKRLKEKKAKTAFKVFSKELEEVNDRLETEIPIFTESLMNVVDSTSKIVVITDDQGLKESISELVTNMKSGIKSSSDFIKALLDWPLLERSFNKSKNRAIVLNKDLVKEMITGYKLLKELI
jgi:hypothetical protein